MDTTQAHVKKPCEAIFLGPLCCKSSPYFRSPVKYKLINCALTAGKNDFFKKCKNIEFLEKMTSDLRAEAGLLL